MANSPKRVVLCAACSTCRLTRFLIANGGVEKTFAYGVTPAFQEMVDNVVQHSAAGSGVAPGVVGYSVRHGDMISPFVRQLHNAFPDRFTLVDSTPFLKTMSRHKRVPRGDALVWEKHPTVPGAPLDDLLGENIEKHVAHIKRMLPVRHPPAAARPTSRRLPTPTRRRHALDAERVASAYSSKIPIAP
ncbi:hypothetical protein KEG38_20570 [Polyangium jinanense]|uniref:hypothetical protein n=1 Tax=Polyangium jinanense TaxID=2829994 RepID=UPI0023424DD8|nr:hypothetical protein [Polyangium jinanense]MDC3956267.1 hypothetical protein [Polyangium jinanense]